MTAAAFLSVLIHLWTHLLPSGQSSSMLLCSSSLPLLLSNHLPQKNVHIKNFLPIDFFSSIHNKPFVFQDK